MCVFAYCVEETNWRKKKETDWAWTDKNPQQKQLLALELLKSDTDLPKSKVCALSLRCLIKTTFVEYQTILRIKKKKRCKRLKLNFHVAVFLFVFCCCCFVFACLLFFVFFWWGDEPTIYALAMKW